MHSAFPANAPLAANCVLVIEIVMGLMLLMGASLARQQRYRMHAACCSTAQPCVDCVLHDAVLPSRGHSRNSTPPRQSLLLDGCRSWRARNGRRVARYLHPDCSRDQAPARIPAFEPLQALDAHRVSPLVARPVAGGRDVRPMVPYSASARPAGRLRHKGAVRISPIPRPTCANDSLGRRPGGRSIARGIATKTERATDSGS